MFKIKQKALIWAIWNLSGGIQTDISFINSILRFLNFTIPVYLLADIIIGFK